MLKFLTVAFVVILITIAIWHFFPAGTFNGLISATSTTASVILSQNTQPTELPQAVVQSSSATNIEPQTYHDPAWPPAYISQMPNPPTLPSYPSGY
jgi:uncharacterized ion transporter superfamily protein YfcC